MRLSDEMLRSSTSTIIVNVKDVLLIKIVVRFLYK